LRHPTGNGAHLREQNEGSQPTGRHLAFVGFMLLALDTDQGTDQQCRGKIPDRAEID
jgi:hypothetical protein